MRNDATLATVPISGRLLALPDGPIFHLHRAEQSDYELGEFRAWAGYKNLGSDEPTDDLIHFQHVLSFAGTDVAGRTGVHAHLAHAHIIIPTSGRGVFSYDGVTTEAVPGAVIVQHGGTIHDQFSYSYAAASAADNRRTPQSVDAAAPDAPPASFSFLELFVPRTFANVEIVPPQAVTPAHERTAWDHPYHTPGARFHLQAADDAGAAFHPIIARPDLEVRAADPGGVRRPGRDLDHPAGRPDTGRRDSGKRRNPRRTGWGRTSLHGFRLGHRDARRWPDDHPEDGRHSHLFPGARRPTV